MASAMKAVQYSAHADTTDVLRVVEVPAPVPSAGDVVVRVVVAAINPVDGKVFRGYLDPVWGETLPLIAGYDFSGVVSAVGEGVSDFAVGDEVFAVNWAVGKHNAENEPVGGAFAEYIRIPARKISKKPAGVSFADAAAVALVGVTAWQSLDVLAPGSKRVLILGGAGAVGTIAVQLAKERGLWVATTCSARTKDFVDTLGADLVIDYTKEDWTEVAALQGVCAVYDTIGEEKVFEKARKVLRADGKFLSIASFDAGFDPAAHAPLKFASFFCLSNDPAVQVGLAERLADGRLRVPIFKEFPFTDEGVRDLFRTQDGGKSVGKNVLIVSESP